MSKRYESRFSRRQERQSKKRFIQSLIGSVVILVIFFKLILPLLLDASSVLSKNKDDVSKKQNSNSFVAPPFLNQSFDATDSATIVVSGTALPEENIRLFINGDETDSTQTKDDGSFNFANVKLKEGLNSIKTKAENQKNNFSDFSNELSISYVNKKPSLSIDSPSDGQKFSKDQNSISVTGQTDPSDKVTVNGFWAIVDDSGKYSYNLNLSNGDNQITVDSSDAAGNTTELKRKVTYSP